MFIDMSAVVTATFYVATVSMHNSLNTVVKVLVCLQHYVQREDVVPLLKRNIEQTITSNNTMLHFIHTALIHYPPGHVSLGPLLVHSLLIKGGPRP